MENKKAKLKKWYEEHKNDFARFAWYALGLGTGCYFSSKLTEAYIGRGFERAYGKGVMKFFDPSTNTEVGADEVIDVMKRVM